MGRIYSILSILDMDDKTYQFLLNEISEHHLKTIKSFSKPPQELVSLFEAVFLLIFNQVPVSWRHSQKLLANISKFMDDIYDLDVNNLSKEQVSNLEQYVGNKDLAPQRLIKIYPNAVPLCNWLRFIYEYKTGKKAPNSERRVTIVESLEKQNVAASRELCIRRHSLSN